MRWLDSRVAVEYAATRPSGEIDTSEPALTNACRTFHREACGNSRMPRSTSEDESTVIAFVCARVISSDGRLLRVGISERVPRSKFRYALWNPRFVAGLYRPFRRANRDSVPARRQSEPSRGTNRS